MRLSRSRSAGLLAVLLLGALACKAEAFGADDVMIDPSTVTVLGGVAFAGGTLTLQSPAFSELAEEPVSATIGGVSTAVLPHKARTDLITLMVPSTLRGGKFPLSLRLPHQLDLSLGEIQISGFAPMRYVLGTTLGTAQVLPHLPGIVATDYPSWHIVVLNARDATFKAESTLGGHYGVGSSVVENSVMANVSGWRRVGWSLGRTTLDSTTFGYDFPLMHELAPGVILAAAKGGYSYLNWGYVDGYGYPDHIAYSQDGRWAVPDHWNSDSGVLVWDNASGTHGWSPRWRRARTAFLPSGELLAVGIRDALAPYDTVATPWLARIDPETRMVLDSVALPSEISSFASIGTTSAGWIVLSWWGEGTWEVSIRDPATLLEIGRSSVAFGIPQRVGESLLLVDDPLLHRWYLVPEDQSDGTTAIATFLMP